MKNIESIGELVRDLESEYINGTTQQSKYVEHSLYNTIERIIAYINNTHISGETDSQGRLKPFANIVKSAVNIWFRATDINRSNIKVKATKSTTLSFSLINGVGRLQSLVVQ